LIHRFAKIEFMNIGKYVFSQIILHLPARAFDRCVEHYDGNKYVKHFTCWNQLMCMVFGQLSGRDSLSDLLVSIRPHKAKFYHLGFGKSVSKTNLALANEQRDYRIFEEFAYVMITKARSCAGTDDDFKLAIPGPVYALDATIIDLCLNVFWWAEFRSTKAAVKIHTLIDVKTSIPCFVHITDATVHDVNGLDLLKYENGGFYVLDRGYLDFKRLFNVHSKGAYFITRARKRFAFNRLSSQKVKRKKGVQRFVFLTNNFQLPAEEIALLYKYRWKIELFFKWIKQHLKVKSFWGTTENAVRIQIYTAIIAYTLIVVIKNRLKSAQSNYEILQILSISLLDKEPLSTLLSQSVNQNVKEQNYDQLKFDLF
jgi:hypothetical protein